MSYSDTLERRKLMQVLGAGAAASTAGCLGFGGGDGGGSSKKYREEAQKIPFGENLEERRLATKEEWPYEKRQKVPARKNGKEWSNFASFESQPWEPPEGWKDTIASEVDELQILNHGAVNMKYDPATVATHRIFEEQTGIELNPMELGVTKATTKEQQVLQSEKGSPTIMNINGTVMPILTRQGWLETTDTLYPEGAWDMYIPALQSLVEWGNDPTTEGTHAYGFPNITEGSMGHVRPDLIEEQGIDPERFKGTWSWDLLEETMKAFKDTGVAGYAYYAGDPTYLSYSFRTLLYQTGGRLVDSNGKVRVDTPAAIKVTRKMAEWYQKGWVPGDVTTYGEGSLADLFLSDQLAYVTAFSEIVPIALNELEANEEYFPTVPPKATVGPNPTQASLVAPNSNGINKFADPAKKVAALLYGDARLSYTSQWWEFTYEGNMSYMSEVYDDASKSGFVKYGDVMGKSIENGVLEIFPQMSRAFKRLSTHVQQAIIGEITPEEAMAQTQNYIDDTVNS